jgi:hypothetical protein
VLLTEANYSWTASVKNDFFVTALVSGHSIGVSISAENIGKAFEVAADYLQERYPRSEVVVQAVQRINKELTTGYRTGIVTR